LALRDNSILVCVSFILFDSPKKLKRLYIEKLFIYIVRKTHINMTKIIVSNDIANIDWTKNVVLVSNDHKAYSNPLLREPNGNFYVVSRKVAKMSKKIDAELAINEEEEENDNTETNEEQLVFSESESISTNGSTMIELDESIEKFDGKNFGQIKEIYNEYFDKGCFLYSNIDGRTLSKVVMFMNQYNSSEKIILPEPIGIFEENVSEWDNQFIINYVFNKMNNMNIMSLKMMLNASSFMAIEYLKDLLCAFTAGEIISKMNEEQMREFFGVEDNLTTAQKEIIIEKNKYVVH
jgi:hypothetical protein